MLTLINDWEAAVFAKAAYDDKYDWKRMFAKLDPDVEKWQKSQCFLLPSGFSVSVFRHEIDKKTVIAFRGTKEIEKDIIPDVQILMNSSPGTLNEAKKIYEENEKNKDDVIFVGHSLGGVLATLMSLEYERCAIVFDVPGCDAIAKKM